MSLLRAPAETVESASRTVKNAGRECLWSGCEPKSVSADQMHSTHHAAQSPELAKPQAASYVGVRWISPLELAHETALCVCFLCVFFPFVLDIKFVGRTSRGHTGRRSHRISHPPSFCGACLIFFARRIQPFLSLVDRKVEFCVLTI